MPDRSLAIIRKRLFLATVAMSLCIIAAFLLAAYSFTVANANSQDINERAKHDRAILCQGQNDSNEALRKVLLLAAQVAKRAKGIPPYQRVQATHFYKQALALVPPIDCNFPK